MGVGLRRVAERVRQATGMSGKNFQPTSNVRNLAMNREATDFASHLKKCLSAIEQMKMASDTLLKTTRDAMGAPLPHVYEDTAAGAGGEVRPVEKIGGPSFQPDLVMRLSQQASAQVESQVLVPIKRWLEVFTTLQANMKEVERLRLEVDSRRHTVIGLAGEVDKMRSKLNKANGSDSKIEASLDGTIKKLQHKEAKLALVVQSFQEKELALYNDLTTLIHDASWLRHYLGLALHCQGEALTGAARALGNDTKPAGDSATSVDISSLSLGSGGPGLSSSAGRHSREGLPLPAGPPPPPQSAALQSQAAWQPQQLQQLQQYQGYSQPVDGAANPFLSSGVIRQ